MDYLALLKTCKNSPEVNRQNRQNLANEGFVSFGSTESAHFRGIEGGFVSFGSTVSAPPEEPVTIHNHGPEPQIAADPDALREAFAERAAIIEHDGGLSRPEAEKQALRCIALEFHFRSGGGGSVLQHECYEAAVLDVVERWEDRLDLPDLAARLQRMGGEADRATKLLIDRMKARK